MNSQEAIQDGKQKHEQSRTVNCTTMNVRQCENCQKLLQNNSEHF